MKTILSFVLVLACWSCKPVNNSSVQGANVGRVSPFNPGPASLSTGSSGGSALPPNQSHGKYTLIKWNELANWPAKFRSDKVSAVATVVNDRTLIYLLNKPFEWLIKTSATEIQKYLESSAVSVLLLRPYHPGQRCPSHGEAGADLWTNKPDASEHVGCMGTNAENRYVVYEFCDALPALKNEREPLTCRLHMKEGVFMTPSVDNFN